MSSFLIRSTFLVISLGFLSASLLAQTPRYWNLNLNSDASCQAL